MTARPRPGWRIVVPVKELARAKSRLPGPPAARAAVALAMARDTVSAAARCPLVGEVLVVTDDPTVARALATAARVVADRPRAGLSAAVEHGAEAARRAAPGCPVAALAADLPGLTPPALGDVLAAAGGVARALVADAAGTGTVLLAGSRPGALRAAFGDRSRAAHSAAGALDLTDRAGPGLRRDVDTLADLRAALALALPAARCTRRAAGQAGWWP